MHHLFIQGFAAGLSLGPVCFWNCGVFHGTLLTRYADAGRRRTLRLAAALLAGRLTAYLGFGLAVGLLAAEHLWSPRPWLIFLVLGGIMAYYAVRPVRPGCACAPPPAWGRITWSAFGLGLLTGATPCPPFLAALVIALQTRGPAGAMIVFFAFFAGTSLWLVPVWIAPVLLRSGWRRLAARASRFIAAGIAAYALVFAWKGMARASRPRAASFHPGVPASAAGKAPAAGRAAPAGAGKRPAPAAHSAPAPKAQKTPYPLPAPAGDGVKPLFVKPAPTRRFTRSILQRLDLSLRKARYWTPMGGGIVRCDLCPSRCILDKGEQGMCRARVNIDGELRTIVYARPVAVHVDPVEKKPLFHVLPGTRAFSIATAGCNLGCVFCQNYEISQAAPEEVPHYLLPPERVAALALETHCAGVAYTYTEPTVFFEYMLDTARLAHARGLKNYWITCGWIQEKPLLELCSVLDAANVDLKGFSDAFYVRYCNAHLFPVLRTLETLRREQVHFEITNLVIPGANDDPRMIRAMCRWIVARLGRNTVLHFSRFHPDYKLIKRPATPLQTLLNARKIALAEGLRYVYVGNVLVPGLEDTICPNCGKVLIKRLGFRVVENNVVHGCCRFCGARIPGIWDGAPPAKGASHDSGKP